MEMSVYLPGYFGGYSDESNSFVLTAYNGGGWRRRKNCVENCITNVNHSQTKT